MLSVNFFSQKRPAISLGIFNIIFAAWLAIALNVSFYQHLISLTPAEGIHSALFIGSSVLIIFSLYLLIFQLTHWQFNAKLFMAMWIILGGLSAYFVNSLGVMIDADQIQNVLQTDTQEAFDLLTFQLIFWILAFVAAPLILIYILPIRSEPIASILLKKLITLLSSLLFIGGSLFIYYVDYAAIFRENRELKSMISPQNMIASSISYYRKQTPKQNLPFIHYGKDAHVIQRIALSTPPKLMVLVVGETARAESFSLNGYAQNTNPELSKLDIINFTQVNSCGTATAVSVPCMFSGMPRIDYDANLAKRREGLLDIAQRAGYKVTWIDNNSGCKGVCDRVEQFQIPASIQQKWCNAEHECVDEILVDSLKNYLAHLNPHDLTPRLIVLHQMGSHGPAYYKRTTAAYQPFQPACHTKSIQSCSTQALLNSYDNSIVYTDRVLSLIIQNLAKVQHYQTAFWYLSDHGESTGEHGLYLHGSPYAIAPSQQTHVPMFMWFSQNWKKNASDQLSCLVKQKNSVLSHDNLFPTLLSLLDISSKTLQQRLNISQCQAAPPRRA